MLSLPRERYYKHLSVKIDYYLNFYLKYAYWLNDKTFIAKVIKAAQKQKMRGPIAKRKAQILSALSRAGVRVTRAGIFLERSVVMAAAEAKYDPYNCTRRAPRAPFDNRKNTRIVNRAAAVFRVPDPPPRPFAGLDGEALLAALKEACQFAIKVIYKQYDLYLVRGSVVARKRLSSAATYRKSVEVMRKGGHNAAKIKKR